METKGRVLLRLESELSIFKVPKSLLVSYEEFKNSGVNVLERINSLVSSSSMLAIRSSSNREDQKLESGAGAFKTVLGVSKKNKTKILSSIKEVFQSYTNVNGNLDGSEVLIQDMVDDVDVSGVVFTKDMDTGAPYYVVNYDDISGLTHHVTSGTGVNSNRTLFIHRDHVNRMKSERFRVLIEAVKELEEKLGNDSLDIEFAINSRLEVFLLQVRSITVAPKFREAVFREMNDELAKVEQSLRTTLIRDQALFGEKSVYSTMCDWNPAEIIGRTPKVLANSLYRELFTDDIWSLARGVMGYKTPEGPLMRDILGQPYIDVRKSINSFLPENLGRDISEKLANEWLERLELFPELHDKVEFDVAITCWTFGFEQLIERSAKTLTIRERDVYSKEMKRLTLELMVPGPNNTLEVAKTKLEELSNLSIDDKSIFELIAECKDLGSHPFAICARHAFVARTILQSLVEIEVLSEKEFDKLLREATTVTSTFIFDFRSVGKGNLSKNAFFQKYGHLRPGTYEITSERYDQVDWTFENDNVLGQEQRVVIDGKLGLREKTLASIQSLMKQSGISSLTSSELIEYCINSIATREEAKFTFTKHVSGILEKLATAGDKHGLSREEISHLSLFDAARLESDHMRDDEVTRLRSQIELHKFNHQVSRAARLPEVIYSETAAYVIPFQVSKPNFVGKQKVSGPLKEVVTGEKKLTLTGAIVMIENADPGFDWIFAEGILGLVTKFGGVNSHMAIRCAELSITAAIGCGDQLFESMRLENLVEIDPQAAIISGIS